MAENSWDPTPQSAGAAEALEAQAVGAFNVGEMHAALPENGETKKKTPAGWVPATPYNYESYTQGASHEWEGNAKTYDWDGEVGDIGPEFPELEIELFGEPGNREKKGIDFSK